MFDRLHTVCKEREREEKRKIITERIERINIYVRTWSSANKTMYTKNTDMYMNVSKRKAAHVVKKKTRKR